MERIKSLLIAISIFSSACLFCGTIMVTANYVLREYVAENTSFSTGVWPNAFIPPLFYTGLALILLSFVLFTSITIIFLKSDK